MVFGLFKKKNKESKKSTAQKYFNATVREVVKVTSDAVNIVFDNPGGDFIYEPGQFITIILTIDGKKVRRAYSLCTTPGVDEFPAVTVKRVEGGLMSNYVNDNVKAGDVIEIMEPMGMFTLPYERESERHIVLLGGGSGITPLISIMKGVISREPKSLVSLVYANRNEDSIIFKNELEAIANENSDRVKVIHSLDEPKGSWDGHSGLLSNDKLKGMLGELPKQDDAQTVYFTCGPEPLMNIVFDTLNEMGVPDERKNKESFVAGSTSPAEIIDADEASGDPKQVKLILDGTEHSFEVAPGKPILEAALEADIDMPYSCQSGLCTACRGKCLSGKVTVEDADGLSKDEIDEGYVLTCIGKPLTDDVVVEIG